MFQKLQEQDQKSMDLKVYKAFLFAQCLGSRLDTFDDIDTKKNCPYPQIASLILNLYHSYFDLKSSSLSL